MSEISAVVDKIAELITPLTDIGRVWKHDIWDREDLADLVVATIGSTKVVRCWWITGPRLTAARVEQRNVGYQERTWAYTIHGIEGLAVDGSDILTLRDNGLAIANALDADLTLGGTCHRTWPCEWPNKPEHRQFGEIAVFGYAEIEKRVLSITTP